MSSVASPTTPWLTAQAQRFPDAVALVDDGHSWTYAQLAQDVRDCSKRLAHLLPSHSRVAFLANNSSTYALWLMASQELGFEAVPLNIRLSAPELGAQLADCTPHLLLCDRAHAALAAQALDHVEPAHSPRIATFEEARDLPPLSDEQFSDRLLSRYPSDRVTTVMYTSGSTGTPKGVQQTFGNHGCSALLCRENLGFSVADRWGCPTPLFHMSGLSILMRSLVCGVGVRLYGHFDAHAVNDNLLSGAVTCLSAVTYQIERLLDDFDDRRVTSYPPTLRFVLQGGGPLPLATLERCRHVSMPVVQSFGMTETASQVIALSVESAPHKPGSSGRPLAGVQMRIASRVSEDDEELPPNTSGRILLKSPTLCSGYLNQTERFASSFTEHGWFDTRDIGHVDKDGYLYVDCRLADLIVSGGENVYPAEVESVLVRHPLISEAAVVGVPDDTWGSVPVAVCVAPSQADAAGSLPSLEELRSFCKERLAPYKCPRRVVWTDRLPTTASGKLKRHAVLSMLAPDQEQLPSQS